MIGLKLSFVSLFWLLASTAAGSNLVGSGDTLAMLQKIQGQWRSNCQQINGGMRGFSITKLDVSFTQFLLKTTVYENSLCVKVRHEKEELYQFALRGEVALANDDTAYAIDFKGVDLESAGLSQLNIIDFQDGKLYLGDRFSVKADGRLTKLDRKVPFLR